MLEKIIKQIQEILPIANEDVEEGNINTLIARRGRQRQAAEQLKVLKEEYARELLRSTAFIVVSGSDAEEFSKIAEEKFDTLTARGEGLYNDLADAIHPNLYEGKETAANLFDVLGRVLEDKALSLGVNEYPQLTFKAQYSRPIANKAEFLTLVQQAINEQVGGELAGIHAVRSVVEKAIAKGHGENMTPITLTVGDPQLALDLMKGLSRLTHRIYLVTAGNSTAAANKASDFSVKLATLGEVKVKKDQSEEEARAEAKKNVQESNEKVVKNSLANIRKLMTKNK